MGAYGVLAGRSDHGGRGDSGRNRRGGYGAQNGAHGGAADRHRHRVRHGGIAVHKEVGHLSRAVAYKEIWHDFVSPGAAFAKAPLLSLTVVLSVGLGIGANTAIFSLFHQILLNSLPVERPEELVTVTSPGDFKGGRNSTDNSGDMHYIFSYPMFRELEKRPQGMSGIAAFRSLNANLSFRKQTISGEMLIVSGGYFATLGVRPLMGRTIGREGGERRGAHPADPGERPEFHRGGGGAQGFHGDDVGGRARRVHSAGLQAG